MSHFKRQRVAQRALQTDAARQQHSSIKEQLDPQRSSKVMFANGPSMWMTLTDDQIPAKSLLARRAMSHDESHEPIMLDDIEELRSNDVFYTLFNCLLHGYDTERQFIGVELSNALRAACDALRLDFAAVVLPYFATVDEYERCVFVCSRYGAAGQLCFINGRAMLSFISIPLKVCGMFRYSFGERLLRLHNVRHLATVDLYFTDAGNLELCLQSASVRQTYLFVNRTPHNLRIAPALPSYFDK
jgi:hypothetical protein